MRQLLMLSPFLLSLIFSFALGHPQCLDYEPPFQPLSTPHFCSNYSTYGCCDADEDHSIEYLFNTTLDNFPSPNPICEDYLKRIYCTQCHPFASHIYDGESNQNRQLPVMCTNFCFSFYDACRSSWSTNFNGKFGLLQDIANKTEFCDSQFVGDIGYCYPDGPSLSDSNDPDIGSLNCLCLEPVANMTKQPVGVVNDGKTNRIFVFQKTGEVFVIYPDGTTKQFFLLPNSFTNNQKTESSEAGLLGMAFHPNFPNDKRVFVYYSSSKKTSSENHISQISSFLIKNNDPDQLDSQSEVKILSISQPFANHNGGQLLFGTDGYLYITLGDGGNRGDPFGNAQNLSTLLGSILRIDINVPQGSSETYRVPPDNPFLGVSNAKPTIYAYGLRNPWRCSFDKRYGTSRLICGDVGQNAYEEVTVVSKGSNHGWNINEGILCYNNSAQCDLPNNFVLPIAGYGHGTGYGKCVIGGYVYNGCRYPNLKTKYLFGDLNGRLFRLEENGSMNFTFFTQCTGVTECTNGRLGGSELSAIYSFGEDIFGEIYIAGKSRSLAKGRVYRLVDPSLRSPLSECPQCLSGYYGSFSQCQECMCNINGSISTQCDHNGKCSCKIGYSGQKCEFCSLGYYFVNEECTLCSCSPIGSVNQQCDLEGTCSCKMEYEGLKCDQCKQMYYSLDGKCVDCGCSLLGSTSLQCSVNGKCSCKEGFQGDKCNQCSPGHFGEECEPCNCSQMGSDNVDCDENGKCYCKTTYSGDKCGSCSTNHFLSQNGTCIDCNCFLEGSNDTQCSVNGKCNCKLGFTGDKCSFCSDGFNGPSCQDINECISSLCNGKLKYCVNTLGSYFCDCFAGYVMENNVCVPNERTNYLNSLGPLARFLFDGRLDDSSGNGRSININTGTIQPLFYQRGTANNQAIRILNSRVSVLRVPTNGVFTVELLFNAEKLTSFCDLIGLYLGPASKRNQAFFIIAANLNQQIDWYGNGLTLLGTSVKVVRIGVTHSLVISVRDGKLVTFLDDLELRSFDMTIPEGSYLFSFGHGLNGFVDEIGIYSSPLSNPPVNTLNDLTQCNNSCPVDHDCINSRYSFNCRPSFVYL